MTTPMTVPDFLRFKKEGRKIALITAYDYSFAKLVDAAGIDAILVGDSLGMVFQGHPNTLSVQLEEILYHARAVAKGVRHAHLIGDLPFMSYQISEEQALESAGRLIQEGEVSSVKLEGGKSCVESVRRMVNAGIPVMGHLGLQPMQVHLVGGFKIQGKDKESEERILEDALALEEAGAYAIVLEMIPASLAQKISSRLQIPTIGIGSGPDCDGQILVISDVLGLYPDFKPRFVRRYAELGNLVQDAIGHYVEDVKSGRFPSKEESF